MCKELFVVCWIPVFTFLSWILIKNHLDDYKLAETATAKLAQGTVFKI